MKQPDSPADSSPALARTPQPTGLRSCRRRLGRAYDSVQVELRGSYSVERMLQFHTYASSHSLAWCALVLAVTPLPCIAITILVDAVPLNPSSQGLAHSHLLWWRVMLMSMCITFTQLEQMRVFVPRLAHTSELTILCMSAVVSVGCTAYALLMASLVGYPLPFTLFFGAPAWQVLFWSCVAFLWGHQLRHDHTLRSEVVAFYKIVVVQLSLTVIYPGYNHVFTRLEGKAQAAFALGLPMLKIFAKNAFRWAFELSEDLFPEFAIFNVEIFHALFVSTCMQSSTSISTTAVIMLADLVQAWLHILDVDTILGGLKIFEFKRRVSRLASAALSSPSDTTPVSPLMTAMLCVGLDPSLQTDSSIRLQAMSMPAQANVLPRGPRRKLAAIRPMGLPSDDGNERVVTSLRVITQLFSAYDLDELEVALTREERRKYVATVLHALHFTEFLVLIEFVEVAVPLVYCSYLVAISHMPNRVFYPHLATMDVHELRSTVAMIFVYAMLEFVSFLGLCVVLQRRLRISPVRHLAFVLHKQWKLVQSKMVLWVVATIGMSLEQLGYDYTFQFAWLRSPSPPP